jgi:hypothetical protein
LLDRNISFKKENNLYKVMRFYPSKMTVEVMLFEDGIKQGVREMPFAHLTKEAKKLIKPN